MGKWVVVEQEVVGKGRERQLGKMRGEIVGKGRGVVEGEAVGKREGEVVGKKGGVELEVVGKGGRGRGSWERGRGG